MGHGAEAEEKIDLRIGQRSPVERVECFNERRFAEKTQDFRRYPLHLEECVVSQE